jgi:hypothetical protein
MTQEAEGEDASLWTVMFIGLAGVLLIASGLFQVFQGIAAIIEADFFVLNRDYAFDLDVTTWGWLNVIVGNVVVVAGVFVFTGNTIARIVGIVVTLVSLLTNFLHIPYYPVWSLLIIALDIGIIWALAFHGRDFISDQVQV